MYEKLKAECRDEETLDDEVVEFKEMETKPLHLLQIYLEKFEQNSDFDITPPKFMEALRFDDTYDVFSVKNLANLTQKVKINKTNQFIVALGVLFSCSLSFAKS